MDQVQETQSDDQAHNDFVSINKPNSILNGYEKETKRRLKALLKQQTKIRKYEVRYHQAISRNDIVYAQRTLNDLQDYITKLEKQQQNETPKEDDNTNCQPQSLQGTKPIVGVQQQHQQQPQEQEQQSNTNEPFPIETSTSASSSILNLDTLLVRAAKVTSNATKETISLSTISLSNISKKHHHCNMDGERNETNDNTNIQTFATMSNSVPGLYKVTSNSSSSSTVSSSSFHWTIWNNQALNPRERMARNYIESMYHELQKRLLADHEDQNEKHQHHHQQQQQQTVVVACQSNTNKQYKQNKREQWLYESRILCKNMTKGTQTKEMFVNTNALLGYTRTKFIERSTLIVQSLSRFYTILFHKVIGPYQQQQHLSLFCDDQNHKNDSLCDHDSLLLYHRVMKRLFGIHIVSSSTTTTKDDSDDNDDDDVDSIGLTVCSIGCGPGCDGAGVLSFYQYQQHNQQQYQSPNNQQECKEHFKHNKDEYDNTKNKNDNHHHQQQQPMMNHQPSQYTICYSQRYIKKIVFMDYTMKQWEPIVKHVKDIMMTEKVDKQQEENETKQRQSSKQQSSLLSVDMVTCDVQKPIFHNDDDINDGDNTTASTSQNILQQRTEQPNQNTVHGDSVVHNDEFIATNDSTTPNSIIETNPNTYFVRNRPSHNNPTDDHTNTILPVVFDIIVVSYLLSETRNQWYRFMDDLIRTVVLRDGGGRSGRTILLLTDPTAWQLHIFRKRYCDVMTFVWLDSSMHRPELQCLEGRVGPAVLLGIVK